jgi:hypothetical protein
MTLKARRWLWFGMLYVGSILAYALATFVIRRMLHLL